MFNEEIVKPDTYVATDGLGREIPTNSETGNLKENKYVGIFFHTWHSHHSVSGTGDRTKILKEHPEIVFDYDSPHWGKKGSYYWNEPIYGYYRSDDRWVLRKQAELLGDAGIDVIIFDNTNGTDTYLKDILVLLDVFAKAKKDGVNPPCISAMLPMFEPFQDTAAQLRELYKEIYKKGIHKDLWFYWKGKPLMMGCPKALNPEDPFDKEILEFFTFRPSNPAYRQDCAQIFDEKGNVSIYIRPPEGYKCWQWITIYPQTVCYSEDGSPEQVCVCIAQNWSSQQGLTAMNAGSHVYGRSHTVKNGKDTREDSKLYGANFTEQWENALEIDPEFIYVTGWNEWVAGRYKEMWGTPNAAPDQFSDEYSRDIEPSKGDLKDHYYYQLVSYIRKFKGTSELPVSSGSKDIDINSKEDMWQDVSPTYYAYPGNTFDRDSRGYGEYYYTDKTGRNDICLAKVCYDSEYVYFMVETKDPLTPYTDKAWMRLFIEVEGYDKSWETFTHVINRVNPGNYAVLEKSLGNWSWEKVCDVEYSVSKNRLQIKVQRAMLGLTKENLSLNFKWSDNMQTEGDIMDFYVHGDTAPLGRFKYRYISKQGE